MPRSKKIDVQKSFLNRLKNKKPAAIAEWERIRSKILSSEWWKEFAQLLKESNEAFQSESSALTELGFDPIDGLEDDLVLCEAIGVDPWSVTNRFDLIDLARRFFKAEKIRVNVNRKATEQIESQKPWHPRQQEILDLLKGEALKATAIERRIGCEHSQFFRYLRPLRKAGLVLHIKGRGYIRPDAPPS